MREEEEGRGSERVCGKGDGVMESERNGGKVEERERWEGWREREREREGRVRGEGEMEERERGYYEIFDTPTKVHVLQ